MFGADGERTDLDEVISLSHKSIQLIPQGHSNWPACLSNLAVSLHMHFEQHLGISGDSDLCAAFNAWLEAINSTPAHAVYRFDIVIHWAGIATKYNYHESALQAYTTAISLLTCIASIGLNGF
jgi:hypothetical protein